MRIITANLNGIRSAASKGFFEWAGEQQADVIGVQEVKAQSEQVTGIHCHIGAMAGQFHYAQKRGYSGVGIYMHAEPSDVVVGLGDNEFDNEGRWVEVEFVRIANKKASWPLSAEGAFSVELGDYPSFWPKTGPSNTNRLSARETQRSTT